MQLKVMLNRYGWMLLLFCLLSLGLYPASSLANSANKTSPLISQQHKQHKQKHKNSMNRLSDKESTKESPFACNMSALTSEQRTRIFSLLKKMKTKMQEVKELSDGYAFRFPMESEMLMEVAEFITYERLCCPFFDFELTVEREGGPLWLKLKGRDGVKDFIRMEFGL